MNDTRSTISQHCLVCGGEELLPVARRADGMEVLRCTLCGMGVVRAIPDDLIALYRDDYYGLIHRDGASESARGYEDYNFTAEHGTGWAAALVTLLRPNGGRVLDIGCADGHLLAKLSPAYEKSGIEVNEDMARIAASFGVKVVGRDLMEFDSTEEFTNRFDIVSAIAVFEHLPNINQAMRIALKLLRDDGVMLFEVPLMSAVHDNKIWFTSSLEHVWYPSEEGLRHLIETELRANLIGTELFISGYASVYVGLVFRNSADARIIRDVADQILLRKIEPSTTQAALARMLLHLVHAATVTPADVGSLASIPHEALNPSLLRRLTELWQADLFHRDLAKAETNRLQVALNHEVACGLRLKADYDIAESDRVRSLTEVTNAIVATRALLATLQEQLSTKRAAEIALVTQKTELERARAEIESTGIRQAAVDAELKKARIALDQEWVAVREVQLGDAWRVALLLRDFGLRFPRAVSCARRIVRTVRRRTWLRQHAQLQSKVASSDVLPDPPLPLSPQSLQPPVVRPLLPRPLVGHSTTTRVPILLDVTGHRPAPSLQQIGKPPLVSVIITSFNYGRFVEDAVESVLGQTFKDLEVIVVEGGSDDPESRLAVAELRKPRTRVLLQGPGHRAGANRNYGISQARGKYVCCLDADDTLAPTYIEKAIYLLERHAYDVVSAAMEKVGLETGQVNIAEHPDLCDLLIGNSVLSCAVFRRTYWERAGGYRDVNMDAMGHVHEDWAFWVRLAALGARFRNLFQDPMLRYRVHGVSLSRGSDVLSMDQQRLLVQHMNLDVLRPVGDAIARSRRAAAVRYGTPNAPPLAISLVASGTQAETHKPTLLLAMPFLILGGAERLLSSVIGHLVQVGWRVMITTTDTSEPEHGDTTSWFEQHTCEIFHLRRGLPLEFWEDFVHHLVSSRDVDIVWVAGSAFIYDCLRGLRAVHPRLRVVDLLFNTVGHTANNRRRRTLIDLTFVENNEVRDWLLRHGESSSRICLVESGVDLARLCPQPRSEALVKLIGAGPGDLIVGFAGRWSEEKNPLGFVEIARLVDPTLPVRFVMTGGGHLASHIAQVIQSAGFPEGRFHVLGNVPELAPTLASFDLLVVPSVQDGRPVVIVEALSMGVPVLGSRVGALPEMIQDGLTGWLYESNDLPGFAKCIEGAAADRQKLQMMRQRARSYAEERLDAKTMFAVYEAGLISLLPGGLKDE